MGGETIPEEADNDPGLNQDVTTTKYPWYIREIKHADLGRKIKLLLLIIGVILGIYYSFKYFSWYFLFGLVTLPIGYFWAVRQLDKERYMLIEVRLKGDQYDLNKLSESTETNIYYIPPDVWHSLRVKGSPYAVGHRAYICDHFDQNPAPDDSYSGTVHFADHPSFSNMNFYTRLKLWLELKKKVPKMLEDLAIYRHNIDIVAQERSLKTLQKMKLLEDFIEDRNQFKHRVLKKPEGEHVGSDSIN